MYDDLVTATMERSRLWEMIMVPKTDDLLQPVPGCRAGPASVSASDHLRGLMMDASPGTVGRVFAKAFRSGQIPSFAELLSGMFGGVSAPRQAEILSLLLEPLGDAAVASMPDGEAVGRLVGPARGRTVASLSQQAGAVSAEQVKRLAWLAEWHDPVIVDRIGCLCAAHTELIAALGEGTLAVVAALLDEEQRALPAKGSESMP